MPLIKYENIGPEVSWGLWEIDENTARAAENLPRVEHGIQYHHPIKQLEYYASRLLLGELCIAHGIEAFLVAKDEFGKPFLPGMEIHISLSHGYPLAAAVLSKQNKCGIDIELISNKPLRVAKKFLNDNEATWVGDDPARATIIWTVKEAIYKHYGRKKLSFKENIEIILPENQMQMPTQGKILLNGMSQKLLLIVTKYDNHVITIAL